MIYSKQIILVQTDFDGDEKLEYLLNCNLEWKPDDHLSFSEYFKKNIFTFVCCLKRIEKKLPFKFGKFVLFEMIKKIDRKSFFGFEFPGEQPILDEQKGHGYKEENRKRKREDGEELIDEKI